MVQVVVVVVVMVFALCPPYANAAATPIPKITKIRIMETAVELLIENPPNFMHLLHVSP
jgi:hypothetical protein